MALDILFAENYFFHTNIVTVLKCLRNWKPFLVNYSHIIELCGNFREPKWGIDFWLRSEIGYGKPQILDGNRVQVSRFRQLNPSKNFREYHPRVRINKSMLKQKITLIFVHIGNSNSSTLNLLNKMDHEKKNSEK